MTRWKRIVAWVVVTPTVIVLLFPPLLLARGFEIASEWLSDLSYPDRICDFCDRVERWGRS